MVARAQNRARDLGNTPANDLPPAALADYARERSERLDAVAFTVLDEAAIRSAGMGAFAAVTQGSEQEARLIRLDYDGGGERAADRADRQGGHVRLRRPVAEAAARRCTR